MVKIHSSLNGMEVHNLKNVLESNDIRCEIRGEYVRAAIGEVPVTEAYVELWVDKTEQEQARRILSDAVNRPSPPWTCPKCRESIDAGFEQCWNCQTDRPS